MKKIKRIVDGPVDLVGMIGRFVELEDGSGRVETWRRSEEGWVLGRTDLWEINLARQAGPECLIKYKVPEEDWPPEMLAEWRRLQQSKEN